MNDLEKEIEESRARLDDTIDRIQGRLSVPNLVDEMLGNARRVPALNSTYDSALEAVRRNPVPVLLIAAGVGLLFNRMARDAERRRTEVSAERVSALNTGAARGYDPDLPDRTPGARSAGHDRDLTAGRTRDETLTPAVRPGRPAPKARPPRPTSEDSAMTDKPGTPATPSSIPEQHAAAAGMPHGAGDTSLRPDPAGLGDPGAPGAAAGDFTLRPDPRGLHDPLPHGARPPAAHRAAAPPRARAWTRPPPP